jgi:type I restriction enzyme S subunit
MNSFTVKELMDKKILEQPMDGNHGELHPTSKDYVNTGIPFVMATDLEDGNINYDTCNNITKKTAEGLRKGFAVEGDVLLSHKATIGRTALVREIPHEYIVLTPQVTYYRVTNKEVLNNWYLKYYFDSPNFQELFKKRAGSGSTRAYLGIIEQQDLPIKYPELEVQDKIVDVLFTIDKKIEINNKMAKELESLIKTIYEYWFVQFEFPNINGKPYKKFNGKMEWNEKLNREIPDGWEVEPLDNNIDTIIDHRGKTPKKLGGDWVKKGIMALSAKTVKNGKLVNLDQAKQVSEGMYKKWMSIKLQDGDILMTSEAPLGEFYYMLINTEYCLSQRLFAIRANKSKVLPSYLYYELSKGNGYSQIKGGQSGSTVFGIRQDELRKINILVPKRDVQKKFEEIVNPMLIKIKKMEIQNQELTQLKDWLIPMFFNGQVIIND